MSRYNYSLNEAYSLVKSRRPEINPNPLFRRILYDYEQELIQRNQARKSYTQIKSNKDYFMDTTSINSNYQQNYRREQRPVSYYYPSQSQYQNLIQDPYDYETIKTRSYYG